MEEENRLIKKRLRLVLKESDGYYKENVENPKVVQGILFVCFWVLYKHQKDFAQRETIETIISSL